MTLIDNWKQVWKFWSFRLAVFTSLLNVLNYLLPELGVSGYWMSAINVVLGLLIAWARVVKQNNVTGTE